VQLDKAVLRVDDVAAIFGVKPATVRRYINRGMLKADPLMGSPKNGYFFAADKLVDHLREDGREVEARLVEQAVEKMPA
jgi:DeoR/GlpR family transcriptional regulator of sugar metabolism